MTTRTFPTPRTHADDGAPAALSVRKVSFDAPWEWLAAGWRDLWAQPAISLSYGAAFAALTGLLLYGISATAWQAAVMALAGGILIIAPLLALGLYEISRRRETGEPVTMAAIVGVKPRSALQLAYVGFALLFLFGMWLRIAFILFAVFFGSFALPPIERFVPELLFSAHGLGMLVVGTIVGAALAAVAYMISAVSVPLLMEHRSDAITAMGLSGRAVVENPHAMALLAALIAGAMACGIATLLLGLVVAFPLIGHATWHAYRALISEAGPGQR